VSCEGVSNVTRIAEEESVYLLLRFSLSISYLVPSLKLRETRRKEIATFFHTARAKRHPCRERVRISFRAKIKLELNHSTFLKTVKQEISRF